MAEPHYLDLVTGERIAYRLAEGCGPGILWLGGFRSDMEGTKAQAIAAWAARGGRASLRFDYFGHGRSSGEFVDGTISHWRDDALVVLDRLTREPQIVVASSMGGWIAMLLARLRPECVAGLLLIAPATDFTELLMWDRMPPDVRRELMERGVWQLTSEYSEDTYPITRALIEDGRRNLVLQERISLSFPVRILHGMADRDVPWQNSLKLAEAIEGNVTVTLVKRGDHRLSTPTDLVLIEDTLQGLVKDVER